MTKFPDPEIVIRIRPTKISLVAFNTSLTADLKNSSLGTFISKTVAPLRNRFRCRSSAIDSPFWVLIVSKTPSPNKKERSVTGITASGVATNRSLSQITSDLRLFELIDLLSKQSHSIP
ncbi:unannotated protein [freshwater metagenome]|uniref:Unannotated protein n=1 Tax=freshwater metagenome TaxID=449393 RepID=A0A6J6GF74_9ZZZZ